MELIDREETFKHFCEVCDDGQRDCKGDKDCALWVWLSDMPTIDTKPIKHATWKYGYCEEARITCYFCSVCGKEAYWDTDYGQQLFDYCPNCGSQMGMGEKK